MTTPLLSVEGLGKDYPARGGRVVRAVDSIGFSLGHGETLGLVGESGCGKSTTGQAAIRLIEPTRGRILFDGEDITRLPGEAMRRRRRDMQIVFQDPFSSLNPKMRVGQIVGEPLLVHGVPRAERAVRVAETLAVVGLAPAHARRFPHQFSGGQRQRIGIARALVLRPKLIICDEAVSALDVSVQAQIVNLLKDVQRDFGVSYLFISHNLAVVRQVAGRIAVMYCGRIVETGPRDALYGRPRHPYTRVLTDAVPVIGRAARRSGLLKGELPDPADPPPGCAFHPRCPIAVQRCRVEVPLLRDLGSGVQAACHLAS